MSEEIKETEVEEAKSADGAEAVEEEKEARLVVFEEALEAILFAAGHPISYSTLARVFETTPTDVKAKVMAYAELYNESETPRGVILLTYADSCQLTTKKYYLTEIREALGIKKSGTLSTSSMEALAIVAYNQPVTRVFVDTLRRADSSYAMNNLLDRGLIESKGRLDAPGRPMLYGTTTDFLRAFGLSGLHELPSTTEEIEEMFAKVNKATEDGLVQEEIAIPEGDATADSAENGTSENADSAENGTSENADSAESGTSENADSAESGTSENADSAENGTTGIPDAEVVAEPQSDEVAISEPYFSEDEASAEDDLQNDL